MKFPVARATLAIFLPPIVRSPKFSIERVKSAREKYKNLQVYGVDYGADTPLFVRALTNAECYFVYGGGNQPCGSIKKSPLPEVR